MFEPEVGLVPDIAATPTLSARLLGNNASATSDAGGVQAISWLLTNLSTGSSGIGRKGSQHSAVPSSGHLAFDRASRVIQGIPSVYATRSMSRRS